MASKLIQALWKCKYPKLARCLHRKMFVVYTMGRVGTVSVRDALVRTAPYVQIEVSHYLTPGGINDREAFRGRRDDRAHRVQAQLASTSGGTPLFISLVRDPVARDVSIVMKRAEVGRYQPRDGQELTVSDLQQEFIKHGPDNVLGWMERELGAFLGVDVYATPFDPERGYHIYELRRGRLLIVKLDHLSRVFSSALAELVGVPFRQPARLNSSCTGPAAEVCDAFRRTLRLEPGLLATYYSSKFARHFFSGDELERLKAKWACR